MWASESASRSMGFMGCNLVAAVLHSTMQWCYHSLRLSLPLLPLLLYSSALPPTKSVSRLITMNHCQKKIRVWIFMCVMPVYVCIAHNISAANNLVSAGFLKYNTTSSVLYQTLLFLHYYNINKYIQGPRTIIMFIGERRTADVLILKYGHIVKSAINPKPKM